jgi:ATP-binding cassette subfamily F protein uup
VGFTLSEGERIGLIGPNGAGKTTLLRILAGVDSPDQGELALRRGCAWVTWPRCPCFSRGKPCARRCWSRRRILPTRSPVAGGGARGRAHRPPGAVRPASGADAPVERLSGGWRKRVALARELVREPELLLLDEPTNHLDVESILWLEKFWPRRPSPPSRSPTIGSFFSAFPIASWNWIQETRAGFSRWTATTPPSLNARKRLLAAQERQETTMRNTLRRETEWLRRGAKARSTKQQARIQRAEALVGAVEELSARNVTGTAALDFGKAGRQPKRLIEAKGIAKSLRGQVHFQDIDLFLGPGSRLGLIGKNGCGKSTLLRVLVGQESPDKGEVLRADNLKVAYFEQQRESLDPNLTVIDTLCPGGDQVDFRGTWVHVNGYLSRFLFRAEQGKLRVGQLSGGEQSRLALARLMLRPANVLVLDEPTNDLDLATLDVLEDTLINFDGAVLLVSHDRYFLDRTTTSLLAFSDLPGGQVTHLVGLSQWEAWYAAELEEIAAAAGRGTGPRRALAIDRVQAQAQLQGSARFRHHRSPHRRKPRRAWPRSKPNKPAPSWPATPAAWWN